MTRKACEEKGIQGAFKQLNKNYRRIRSWESAFIFTGVINTVIPEPVIVELRAEK